MKIATLAFAGSTSTYGLTLVTEAIKDKWPTAELRVADAITAKHADYLLVSLYWWKDVYSFVRWLHEVGINPESEKPVIIIGGMSALNPSVLEGYFDYCVVGDGEVVICDLIERIEAGEKNIEMVGVWNKDGCEMAHAEKLTARTHVDLRTNRTSRIEIARGCKLNCPFCELTHIKPYRELPYSIIKHLVLSAETKSISLFAPDTWSHSMAEDIEQLVRRCGKNNTGSDVRLDVTKKISVASRLRFGVEGFGEKTRRRFKKVVSNKILVDRMLHVINNIETPKGNPISGITCYMIGDLPIESEDEIIEFWDVLKEISDKVNTKRREKPFTMFLSISGFHPMPFTPMWNCGIHPYGKFNDYVKKHSSYLDNIVIALRGSVASPAQRLAAMLTIRGDERCSLAINWLATKGYKYTKSTKPEDGKVIEAVVKKTGFDPTRLYRQLDKSETMPWMAIKTKDDRWKREW